MGLAGMLAVAALMGQTLAAAPAGSTPVDGALVGDVPQIVTSPLFSFSTAYGNDGCMRDNIARRRVAQY